MDYIRPVLILLGIALVSFGGLMLLYLGTLVFQVINHPADVELVRYIVEQVKLGDRAIYGNIGPQPIEINITEASRSVMFLFTGVLIMTSLAGILKALIAGGINIITLASTGKTKSVDIEPR